MSSDYMSDMRRAIILDMARGHLYQEEIEDHHFMAVLDVLIALGWINEVDASAIRDDIDELFPSPPAKKEFATKMLAANLRGEVTL